MKTNSFDPQALTSLTCPHLDIIEEDLSFRSTGSYEPDRETVHLPWKVYRRFRSTGSYEPDPVILRKIK